MSKYIDRTDGNLHPAIEECCADFLVSDCPHDGNPISGRRNSGEQAAGRVKRMVSALASSVGDAPVTPVFAMAEAANALASKGAKPKGLLLALDLPEWLEEKTLEHTLREAARAGKEHALPILNIQVQTVPSLAHILVHATAIGHAEGESSSGAAAETKNLDVVVAGSVGLAGSLQILAEKEAELKTHFQQAFLNTLRRHEKEIFASEAVSAAYAAGAGIWQTGQGGILAALWNMGETLGVGMELDMKKFPILQETVEVCEQYDVNPYLLTSAGTMIFALPGGERLKETLVRAGCRAAVIGHTIRRKERVLRNGEDFRYLDRPAADEIWKLL